MSNPKLNYFILASTAVLLAFGTPIVGGYYLYEAGMEFPVLAALIVVGIYVWMSVGMAQVMILSNLSENETPLGPSLTAGSGLLILFMLVLPLVFGPGLVWWYILPIDELGYWNWDKWLNLSEDEIRPPHHAGE